MADPEDRSEATTSSAQEAAIETVEAIKERLGISWSPGRRPDDETETEPDDRTDDEPDDRADDEPEATGPITDEAPAIDPTVVGDLIEAPPELDQTASMATTPADDASQATDAAADAARPAGRAEPPMPPPPDDVAAAPTASPLAARPGGGREVRRTEPPMPPGPLPALTQPPMPPGPAESASEAARPEPDIPDTAAEPDIPDAAAEPDIPDTDVAATTAEPEIPDAAAEADVTVTEPGGESAEAAETTTETEAEPTRPAEPAPPTQPPMPDESPSEETVAVDADDLGQPTIHAETAASQHTVAHGDADLAPDPDLLAAAIERELGLDPTRTDVAADETAVYEPATGGMDQSSLYSQEPPPGEPTTPMEATTIPIDSTLVRPTPDLRPAPPILGESQIGVERRRGRAAGILTAILGPLLVAGGAVVAWIALTSGSDPVVGSEDWPRLSSTLDAWADAIDETAYWESVGATLLRIGVASAVGVVGGLVVGWLTGRFPIVRNLLRPLTDLFRVVAPVLLVPFLVLWFGLGDPAGWVPAALGIFALTSWSMAAATDDQRRGLGLNVGERAVTAVRTGLAVGWPLVFAAELIGTRTGVGAELSQAFTEFDTELMVVWLLTAVVMALAVDAVLRLVQYLLARRARALVY